MDCIFCDMQSGQLPASWVHADDDVFAIMDLVQPNPYKVLVIPRRHVESLFDLTEREAGALMQRSVEIARAIREVSGCQGLNLLQSNGEAAGQTVFHVHVHLFPRFVGDGMELHWPHQTPPRTRLNEMAEALKAQMS